MAGGIPVSKGQIDNTFVQLSLLLQQQAMAMANDINGAAQRPWQSPQASGSSWPGDPLDIPGASAAFDRTKSNQNFVSCINDASSPGTTGDVVGIKVQVDYVGIMERGWRTRQNTTVRCLAHAAGRRSGHGDGVGIFSDASGVIAFAQAAIAAGQTTPPYGGNIA